MKADRPGAGRGRDRARQEDDGRDDLDLLRAHIDDREAQPQRGEPDHAREARSASARGMSAYRFCRTDDIGLLVDALNRCWSPHFPGEPPMTPAAFKRSIRDLQVWCSSCMVAFSGSDPIGVLIGAKRPSGTLIHKIAVHPDHLRQGHGRHLLTSLSSKLAILGPPRMSRGSARDADGRLRTVRRKRICPGSAPDRLRTGGRKGKATRCPGLEGTFVIPVTVDDLAANGLLEEISRRRAGSARSRR